MPELDSFAFNQVRARGRAVQQGVHQVVVQQVDFVDIEQPAVRRRQQAWLELALAAGQRRFQVQRADHAVLGGRHRQIHDAHLAGG